MKKPALKPIVRPTDGSSVALRFYSYLADNQGCGTIRVIYPCLLLNHFRYPKIQTQASFGQYFIKDLDFYRNFTWVQFQRACSRNHFNMIESLKYAKVPVIYEIDDLLTDIPAWNYANDYYKNQIKNIEAIMSKVDGIIVSTQKLKEVYRKYNKKIEVIPNHLPKFIWGDVQRPIEIEGKPRIYWGGSSNHFSQGNVPGGDFSPLLIDYIKKTTDKYTWVLVGGFPSELYDIRHKIELQPWQPIFGFPAFLKSLKAHIGIVPLMDNLFNQCKSNIKMLENVAAGIPTIYKNIEPYYNSSYRYETDEMLIHQIEMMVANPQLRISSWEADYAAVEMNLFWEENDNLKKYLDSYLKLFGKRL